MNTYGLTLAAFLTLGTTAQAGVYAPSFPEVAQHQDFAPVAELRVIAKNTNMQSAWVERYKAETEIKVKDAFIDHTLVQGMAVVAAGFCICALAEWVNEYRARYARTTKEIEMLKLNLALEKARAEKRAEVIQKNEQEPSYNSFAVSIIA